MAIDLPPFVYDNTDDGSRGLPTYLGQALQFYGTNKSSQLPSYLSYPLNNQPGQSIFGGGAQFSAPPISQAMAPQPDTPVSNAMAPQPPSTPLGQAMSPQLSPIQRMFQRQATDPNLSLDDALIAGGSAMMGGKNFQEGAAAAGQAFNGTFDKTLNAQRDLNTPRVTPLADGAFSMVQLPGQSPQVLPNAQVANYLMGKQVLAGRLALNKDVFMANLNSQRDAEKNDRLNAQTYGPKLQMTNQAIETTQRALDEAQRQGAAAPTMSKLEGAFPGVANWLGTPDAPGNNLIQNALVDTQLAQDALKSGAITDQQAKTLGADIPGITSDRNSVLVPFLQRRLEALKRYQAYQQSQVNKANPAPTQGFVSTPQGGGSGVLSNGGPVRGNGMSYVQ